MSFLLCQQDKTPVLPNRRESICSIVYDINLSDIQKAPTLANRRFRLLVKRSVSKKLANPFLRHLRRRRCLRNLKEGIMIAEAKNRLRKMVVLPGSKGWVQNLTPDATHWNEVMRIQFKNVQQTVSFPEYVILMPLQSLQESACTWKSKKITKLVLFGI